VMNGRLRWLDWGAMALLVILTLAFHWPLITPDLARRCSYPSGDFYDQFHAFASYEHDRIWAGEVPLWNPYNYAGHPFLADIQAAVFYPLSLLIILISGPGPFSPFWLQVEAIIHFGLAAVLTYLFARRLLVRVVSLAGPKGQDIHAGWVVAGALLSALTFTFGGYLTGYPAQQLAILEVQVWLPLILLLLDSGMSSMQWGGIWGAGLAWGMALLAGHPQSAMYVFYTALLYGAFRAWQARLPWRRFVLAHLTWMGSGVGLAAVHLLPAFEFMRLSVRSSATYEQLAGGLGWRDMVQYLLPGTITHWSPVYVGILPLFLAMMACVGVWSRGKRSENSFRREVAFWAVLTAVSLVLSMGGHTFVYRLFYWVVPGFNLFRSQERAVFVTGFCLAVLAGYGWIWLALEDRRSAMQRWERGVLVAAGGITLAALVAWIAGGATLDGGRLRSLLVLVGCTWGTWGVVRWRRWARLAKPSWMWVAALVLVAIDLGITNIGTNLSPGSAEEHIYDSSWLEFIQQDTAPLFRIANEWGLPGNIGCWLRRQDWSGASPLRLQVHKVMGEALPHWRLWQLLGVRYVITWEHDCPCPYAWTRVAMQGKEWEKNTVYVHRLDAEFPRAWVVHRALQVGLDEALARLAEPDFDPFQDVLVDEPVPEGFSANDPLYPAVVSVIRYRPEEIVVQADLSAAGWLVLGEWVYPGWKVWVDGEKREIYHADYGLRAVPLSTGPHRVEFRFRPLSVYLGGGISVLTGVMCVAACIVATRRGRMAGDGLLDER
jgi:hypothetical protein